MKHYAPISPKSVGRGEEKRKFGLCTMGTAQISERLYCLVLVSSCPPSAVFTAYCTWIHQPWGHRVSWNTLATLWKSRDGKTARLGGLIQEQIEEKFSCERVTTMPKHERKIEIGRGEVVLYNAYLAKTSSTFSPTTFIFHEKDIWCRQWHWSIFSHSTVPLPRTSF